MSMQDPLADLLTRIRNALMVGKLEVSIPSSKLKLSVLKVLRDEGYIQDFEKNSGAKPEVTVKLKYFENKPVIEKLTRISRPGLRIYKNVTDIPKIKNGYGVAVVSTSKGVVSDREARQLGVGGELLCTVF